MEIRSDLGGVIFFGGVTRDVWERDRWGAVASGSAGALLTT